MSVNGQTTETSATTITALRKKLGGVSMETLARRLGVSYKTVWDWQHGRRRPSQMARRLMRELLEKVTSEEQRR